jgi:uncharacterized protein
VLFVAVLLTVVLWFLTSSSPRLVLSPAVERGGLSPTQGHAGQHGGKGPARDDATLEPVSEKDSYRDEGDRRPANGERSSLTAAAPAKSSDPSPSLDRGEEYDFNRPWPTRVSSGDTGDVGGAPPLEPDPPSSTETSPSPTSTLPAHCANFGRHMFSKPGPESDGKRKFPYMRPPPECRTFHLPAMESLLAKMKAEIKDPDLYRLFENSFPNTLDTMVKWRGYANKTDLDTGNSTVTDQELTYVITGDIDAMWLRDSASQIYSYVSFLEPSKDPDSLASLWRGLINSHARYILISPYCHSFQPPPESGILPTHNDAYAMNNPNPSYDPIQVFDCKWELDSLASFLQISTAYYERTGDITFFQKHNWTDAVEAAVDAAGAMRLGTYAPDGKVENSAWTFTGWTNRGSETLTNDGLGNPVKENGMVRSGFRPSDDACIFQLLVPANMMFAKYLESASLIMDKLDGAKAKNLTLVMRDFAFGIRKGIDLDAIVPHRDFGEVYAYEVDGFGSTNMMDDANIPSLLAMPLWNYSTSTFRLPDPLPNAKKPRDYDQIYQNTRRMVLSDSNPYFMKGPVISAIGGPHIGPGKAWPMAAIVAGLTAYTPDAGLRDADAETVVGEQLRMVLDSTAGTGVVHESVSSWNDRDWTRAWFGWANGLFGELIMKIYAEEKRGRKGKGSEGLLRKSWQ